MPVRYNSFLNIKQDNARHGRTSFRQQSHFFYPEEGTGKVMNQKAIARKKITHSNKFGTQNDSVMGDYRVAVRLPKPTYVSGMSTTMGPHRLSNVADAGTLKSNVEAMFQGHVNTNAFKHKDTSKIHNRLQGPDPKERFRLPINNTSMHATGHGHTHDGRGNHESYVPISKYIGGDDHTIRKAIEHKIGYKQSHIKTVQNSLPPYFNPNMSHVDDTQLNPHIYDMRRNDLHANINYLERLRVPLGEYGINKIALENNYLERGLLGPAMRNHYRGKQRTKAKRREKNQMAPYTTDAPMSRHKALGRSRRGHFHSSKKKGTTVRPVSKEGEVFSTETTESISNQLE